MAASAQYTAGHAAVKLSNALTVADPDNQNLTSATVAIAGGTFAGDGDVLAAVTTATVITASYNSSTETLVLSGSDTLAHYQKVLRSVTFNSTNADPTNSGADPTRVVSWELNDGSGSNAQSAPSVTTVAIPPMLTIGNHSITVAAGGSIALPITVSPSGSAVTVNITGLTSYETITDHSDSTVFSGDTVTLTASEVNSGLILSTSYTGTGHPVNTLTVTANDTANGGTSSSAPQTITVTDPPPDPAPVLWQLHDTGSMSVLAGSAMATEIAWSGDSSPLRIGDITNAIALPGTSGSALNSTGFALSAAVSSFSPGGVLWTAMDPVSPALGEVNLAGSQLIGGLSPGMGAGAGVADGGLVPGASTLAQQHLVFGGV